MDVKIIDVGIEGRPGRLEPEDRALVQQAVASGTALAEAVDQAAGSATAATGAAVAAGRARDTILGMTVTTGAPGSAAVWYGETGTMTVPRGDEGRVGPPGPPGKSVVIVQATTDAAYTAALAEHAANPLALVVRV